MAAEVYVTQLQYQEAFNIHAPSVGGIGQGILRECVQFAEVISAGNIMRFCGGAAYRESPRPW